MKILNLSNSQTTSRGRGGQYEKSFTSISLQITANVTHLPQRTNAAISITKFILLELMKKQLEHGIILINMCSTLKISIVSYDFIRNFVRLNLLHSPSDTDADTVPEITQTALQIQWIFILSALNACFILGRTFVFNV